MADGPNTETYANHSNPAPTNGQPVRADEAARATSDDGVRRALIFVGIAAASAGIAYGIVRATLARPPSDPTTERIQQLIDEANRLLKQLDDKKSD